jgi:hypothetical protein
MSAQGAINVRNKVSDLQSKLSHAAKQSLDRKFGALYDKIYREDVIWEAWKQKPHASVFASLTVLFVIGCEYS